MKAKGTHGGRKHVGVCCPTSEPSRAACSLVPQPPMTTDLGFVTARWLGGHGCLGCGPVSPGSAVRLLRTEKSLLSASRRTVLAHAVPKARPGSRAELPNRL